MLKPVLVTAGGASSSKLCHTFDSSLTVRLLCEESKGHCNPRHDQHHHSRPAKARSLDILLPNNDDACCLICSRSGHGVVAVRCAAGSCTIVGVGTVVLLTADINKWFWLQVVLMLPPLL